MKVKITHIDHGGPIDLTEIHFSEANALCDWIRSSGGVYYDGINHPFLSYQIAMEQDEMGNGQVYMEIHVGKEDPDE